MCGLVHQPARADLAAIPSGTRSACRDTSIRAGPTAWCLLPSNGVDTMTSGHIQHSPAFPDPAVGAVVAATWLAVIVGAAHLAFMRRDS